MDWELWEPKYRNIVDRLDLDPVRDLKSAKIMKKLLPKRKSLKSKIKNLLEGRECLVFGAGPSLEIDLKKISDTGLIEKTIITADGATSAVMDYRIPDIIVTDLDGNIEDQITAWSKGSWLVVHAHGDNIEKIKTIVPRLNERVLGTTQVHHNDKLENFGGFTDGDRAAFMAHELGAKKIYLAGFDLGNEVGIFSGTEMSKEKRIKLEICGELLSWLSDTLSADIVNLTSKGEEIPNVRKEDIMT